MFINLTHISFTENTLNAYKFRVLALCPELTAQDLIEENDEYEGYRTFLFSKVKDIVLFIVVNLMIGDIPRICELSSKGDRLLNYGETKRFLIDHITCKTGKNLNISVSPEHQETIGNGVRDAVRKALQAKTEWTNISRSEEVEDISTNLSMRLCMETQLITKAIYNFEHT